MGEKRFLFGDCREADVNMGEFKITRPWKIRAYSMMPSGNHSPSSRAAASGSLLE